MSKATNLEHVSEHIVIDHLLPVRLRLISFDSLEKWLHKVILHASLGTGELPICVELGSFSDVFLESTVLDLYGLNGIAQDEGNRITSNKVVSSLLATRGKARILSVNRLAELQEVKLPGLTSIVLFRARGSASFPVNNTSVIPESSSLLG